MKYIFIIIGLFFSSYGVSQTKINGRIIDIKTKTPIPYAHVLYKDKGVLSDENGNFRINELVQIKEIIVTNLAYSDTLISINNITENNLIIYLTPKSYEIQEITVTPPNSSFKVIEPYQDNKSRYWFCNNGIGSQWVHYFPSDNLANDAYLNSFSMFFKGKIKQDRKVRIRVYSADNKGEPFKNLLEETVIFNLKGRKKWEEFKLSKYNIVLPKENGYFVGIEFLPNSLISNENEICLGMNHEVPTYKVWVKLLGGKWHKANFFRDHKGRVSNLMTKVKIEEYPQED